MKKPLYALAIQPQRVLACAAILLSSTVLYSCAGNDNNDSNNDVITDPPASEEPVTELPDLPVTPTADQAVIYYKRDDANYTDWGLHLWGAQGASYTDTTYIGTNGETQWTNPFPPTGISDDYGAYFVIEFDSEDWTAFNFIIHLGDEQDIGGVDHTFTKEQFGDDLFTFSGNGTLFEEPLLAPPVGIEGAGAIWIDEYTVVFNATNTVTLHAAEDASISVDSSTQAIQSSNEYELTSTSLSSEQSAAFPHLADTPAWQLPATIDAKTLLTQQLVIAESDGETLQQATKVQIAGAVDDVYGEAASALNYWPEILGGSTSFRLWAPTAQNVELVPFVKTDSGFEAQTKVAMQWDEDSGSWSVTTDAVAINDYYQYALTVYHPLTNQIEQYNVADPYSLNTSAGSLYSQLVDMNDAALTPSNWQVSDTYQVERAEQVIVYEAHVRDFSNSDSLGTSSYNGKYLAFTEANRESMSHLQSLQQAGLTHLHLLPSFDIATVIEDESQRIDLHNTKAELCAINSNALICGMDSVGDSDTIEAALSSCDTSTECAQAIMADVRGLDGFNWGYDPVQYSVPEGSYASDASNTSRVLEFRQMVQSLHDMGLSVVMDVVYNHTNSSGLFDFSVLDRVVPGYYHRLNPQTGAIENSTCCENTASENVMMEKLMIDSLVHWASEYHIDGFRFDLMGHHTKTNIEKAYTAVDEAADQFIYFYGEGWNFGEVVNNARFEQATQANMAGTGVGSFSDRIRDSLRGGGPFDSGDGLRATQGFANGLFTDPNEMNQGSDSERDTLLHETDLIRLSMAAGLKDYRLQIADDRIINGVDLDYKGQAAAYADDPQEWMNYVSKHDNQTLWDVNQYKLPSNTSVADRVRMQNLALNTILMAQGVPFLHMGSELLRSKSMERDSFDSGDWFNRVYFDMSSNNWNVGLPREDKDSQNWDTIRPIIANSIIDPTQTDIETAAANFKEFIGIRSNSALFSLATKDDVMARVDFHNTGSSQTPGVIAMSIDDGTGLTDLDGNYDAIMVIINATPNDLSDFISSKASGFSVHPALSDGTNDDPTQANTSVSDNGFNVPARTVSVFVKTQGASQGEGLAVSNKELTPTELQAPTFIRGSLYGDGWPADDGNELEEIGEGIYAVTLELEAGSYEFKVASEDWSTHNWGNSQAVTLDSPLALIAGSNDNIQLTISEAGSYRFVLDVTRFTQATITVSAFDDGACTVLETSSEAGPLGSTALYVRGDHSGWNADNAYRLDYKGDNTYQAFFSFAGSMQFKLADASTNWDVQYFVENGASLATLEADIPYTITRGNAGTDNNRATLPAGEWSFLLQLTDPLVLDGEAGSLIIQECSSE